MTLASRPTLLYALLAVPMLLAALLWVGPWPAQAQEIWIEAQLQPTTQDVKGQLRWLKGLKPGAQVQIEAHPDMQLKLVGTQATLSPLRKTPQLQVWQIEAFQAVPELSFEFTTPLRDDPSDGDSTGFINERGAVMFGASAWYPKPLDPHRANLSLRLPAHWRAHAVGLRAEQQLSPSEIQISFNEALPQDGFDVVAGEFHVTEVQHGSLRVSVWLKTADPALAQSFLQQLPAYIDHFSKSIGDYPYGSFAVIENSWETGYGMPSFTLLGPSVMRLPFILTSSLPHEVLHNWWGNSVYVDESGGNWCEGLTTYMADHWQREIAGDAAEYRRQTLSDYMDYVISGKDFPLRRFRGRHSSATQAIGYGKGMMLFHMLRVKLGDSAFQQGLKKFYRDQLGRRASWEDLRLAFESVTSKDLREFFAHWLDGLGAVNLSASAPRRVSDREVCLQLQSTSFTSLDVPVKLRLQSGKTERRIQPLATSGAQEICWSAIEAIRGVDVDGDFEMFRTLTDAERPPALSALFASKSIDVISSLSVANATGFVGELSNLIEAEIDLRPAPVPGATITPRPGRSILLVGESADFENLFAAWLKPYGVSFTANEVIANGQSFEKAKHSFFFAARDPQGQTWVWVRAAQTRDLARRFVRYGRQGAVALESGSKVVPLKISWPILQSPLSFDF
ncbi:MAG TPA: M1 family aminopeptidase [Pseudobdellovibrionaceae bacterium]|nr:M1 family aminopeptidase [Pseudobdellovibrionaceae bacterium]